MLIRERRIQYGGARVPVGRSIEKDLYPVIEVDGMLSEEAHYGVNIIVVGLNELGSICICLILLFLAPVVIFNNRGRSSRLNMAEHMVPPLMAQNMGDHAGVVWNDRGIEYDDRSEQAVYVRFNK